ncbi:MAG TPA: hypothetical protein VM118_14555 [Acidobacteriota bacterium]|nr:hypothetical protein [Acidobacteriota bacterium]
MSRDRGEIIFTTNMLEVPGRPSVTCIMHLPSRELTTLTYPPPQFVSTVVPAIWGADRHTIYCTIHGDSAGLWRVNRRDSSVTRLLPHRHRPPSTGDRYEDNLVIVNESGTTCIYEKPHITISDSEVALGRKTGKLYTFRDFYIDQGPRGWSIDLDTMDLPQWVKDIVSPELNRQQASCMVLMESDSLGGAPIVLWKHRYTVCWGFAVSPDENQFAYTGPDEVRVWDRGRDTTLIPARPKGYHRSRYPAFSPDGRSLAFIAARNFVWGPAAVAVNAAPNYDSAVHLFTFEPGVVPQRVCWSPDGEWLLVQIWDRRQHRLHIGDVIAIEVATGERVEVARPFLVDGQPDSRFYVGDGIDWIE